MKSQLTPERHLSRELHTNLRESLDAYYAKPVGYMAFEKPSSQADWWSHLGNAIRVRSADGEKVRVLEIGSGMSGFAGYLEQHGIRDLVELHAHDVTSHNVEWLSSAADQVHIGEVSEIDLPGEFDIIFSTYVLEHVSNPWMHLETLWKQLVPPRSSAGGGSLFLISPRYDLFGYLCPASRHEPPFSKLKLLMIQWEARCRAIIAGEPQFLIQTDPAVFHRPFFPDADAVHWVSLHDIRAWARAKGSTLRKLRSTPTRLLSKQWLIRNHATLAVEIRRS